MTRFVAPGAIRLTVLKTRVIVSPCQSAQCCDIPWGSSPALSIRLFCPAPLDQATTTMDITDGRLTCPPTDQTFSSPQSKATITVKWFTLTTEGSHPRQVAFSNPASELYIVDSKCARGNCDGRYLSFDCFTCHHGDSL